MFMLHYGYKTSKIYDTYEYVLKIIKYPQGIKSDVAKTNYTDATINDYKDKLFSATLLP